MVALQQKVWVELTKNKKKSDLISYEGYQNVTYYYKNRSSQIPAICSRVLSNTILYILNYFTI